MKDTITWEERINGLTHILTSPTTSPPLYSQLFIANQIPCFLNWDYPPLLCPNKAFPSPHFKWVLSFFLKRVVKYGPPQTSWRSKCPYLQPPPLVLAKGLEEAHWGEQQRREAFRKRLRRRRLVNNVNPLIPIVVPNLLLLSFLFWDPPVPDIF